MPTLDQVDDARTDLIEAEIRGQKLSAEEAEALEEHLRQQPDDLHARVSVVAYYFWFLINPGNRRAVACKRALQNYADHLTWLIDEQPELWTHQDLQLPFFTWDDRDRAIENKLKRNWLKQVALRKKNTRVLRNAAQYFHFALDNDRTAEKLLKQAMHLQPRIEDFPQALSHIYELRAHSGSATTRKANCLKSVDYLFQAWKLNTRYPCLSYLSESIEMLVEQLCGLTLELKLIDETKKLANILLELKPRQRRYKSLLDDWSPDVVQYREATHRGSAILGRAALSANDVDEANSWLAKMSRSYIPPKPDWELAQELLQHSEVHEVIKYLRACQRAVRKERERLNNPDAIDRVEVPKGHPHTKQQTLDGIKSSLEWQDNKLSEQIEAIQKGERLQIGLR